MGRPFRAGLLPRVCASLLSFTWHVAPASMYGGFPNSSVLHIHNREFSIPIEILSATASEEASTWETAFQEGSGLPLWAPHVLRVPSPGPHSLLCRSLCPFCCFLHFIFPVRALSRACGKVSFLHPLWAPCSFIGLGPQHSCPGTDLGGPRGQGCGRVHPGRLAAVALVIAPPASCTRSHQESQPGSWLT